MSSEGAKSSSVEIHCSGVTNSKSRNASIKGQDDLSVKLEKETVGHIGAGQVSESIGKESFNPQHQENIANQTNKERKPLHTQNKESQGQMVLLGNSTKLLRNK